MKLHNETIKKYLKLVSQTEPPVLHHIWSLVAMMSANLGRRCYFEFGPMPILPNQYILLVGDPGVRKSTAMSLAKKLIKGNQGVRLAPDDTGGQRQGLIAAMLDNQDDDIGKMLEGLEGVDSEVSVASLDIEDRHTLFCYASEFASFIGQGSYEMVTFLTKMWDGEDHNYTLKNSKCLLEKPLLNLLGGTTPTALASSLPMEVVGQGFLSRVVLVYAESAIKIPRPQPLDEQGLSEIRKIFDHVQMNLRGAFKETAKARELLDSLYLKQNKIEDTRFVYYLTRRHTHLIKLVMAMAALRGSQEIIVEDVEDAQALLSITEESMPSALGEFGLSPLGLARQKLLDYINASPDPFTANNLWSLMQRDMKLVDFTQTLKDFVAEEKIACWEDGDVIKYARNLKKQNKKNNILEDLL